MDQHASSIGKYGRREGMVCRLASDGRFGYVRTTDGTHANIFVVGRAVSHHAVAALRLGSPVGFHLAGRDSVEDLHLA